jgi:hypothetical protein
MVHCISYDLSKPTRNYNELYEVIKGLGGYLHFLESAWLVSSNLNASQIWQKIKLNLDKDDNILIIDVGNDYNGRLPEAAGKWIRDHII